MSGNPSYCSLKVITDISGITVPVGDPANGTQFNFQVGPSPPPYFFTIGGIYSQRLVQPMEQTFNRLYAQLITVDLSAVDPFCNNDMDIDVSQLSYRQQLRYQELIRLFQKVYGYNLAAYTYAGKTGTIPMYYTFETSSELTEFREANGLINLLYNVNPLNYPVTSLFFMPFPPFCN